MAGEEAHRETRRDIIARITSKAWTDEKFKARLLNEPETVLREFGIEVPDDIEIVMHEDSPKREHAVLLSPPPGLTHEQLKDPRNVHFFFCFTAFHHRGDRPGADF